MTEFFTAVGVAISSFFEAYGTGFAMLVLAGFIIAAVVELGVKKAFDYLEGKFKDKDGILSALGIAKTATVIAVTFAMAIISTKLILKAELPLPGNEALAPFWFAIIYFAQYVFSMYGIKTILRLKDAPKKEKAPKQPKPKKVSPVEGMTKLARNVYRNADGELFNKKGEKL